MGQGETTRLIAIHTQVAQACGWKNEAGASVSQCFKRFDHVWCNRPDGQCEHAGGRCIDRDSPPGTKLGERTFNGGLAGCGE
jgi:hypothetical protein